MRLFETADTYCKESNWKTLAMLKFCLFAMGLMVGMQVPKRHRKAALFAGALVFTATYIPLMTKFLRICMRKETQKPISM